ncbi:fumarylacetoacetate hydrolase family protein [Arcicella lustrica]|uniref:Fumarylacetoacetate hydrolase family protein n=1 Tax=Arcicella lustrica TaxID=2984196 RepID=A0ABU5SPV5_9BACT|nr:fumarylacetoacetate hydrolase family protein [Arcicella sp. DC25W]MEA5429297.1 fumarylacetoacetate hydrolase family protein [Arcicella sp. DC25W]
MKKLLFISMILMGANVLLVAQSLEHTQIKLFRFGNFENEKPAVEYPAGNRLDVSDFGEDFNEKFFATNGVKRLQQWLTKNAAKCKKVGTNVRMGSPVARPSKIIAIGLNYIEHVKEGPGQGVSIPIPREPVIFLKSSSALSGPYDDVLIPKNSQSTDYELELAVVIGKKASYVTVQEAMSYVAGYSIINDVSEREWQLKKDGGQWDKGKSSDTFAPVGPYLVLSDNIDNSENLKMWLKVNGKIAQQANTKDLIFKLANLISYISQHMTLLPGDIIATGTPSGVGLGQKPPKYLKVGDEVELYIESIGTQKQTIGSYVKNYLSETDYEEYKQWVALGLGGLPHTVEGFKSVQNMNKALKSGTDWKRIEPYIGEKGDIKSLQNLPKRIGTKPTIAPFAVPHRQTDQHNTEAIRKIQSDVFDVSVANSDGKLIFKNSYLEIHNPGIFLKDSASGNQSIVPVSHAEIGHIHHFDGSMHIILSPSDTKEVIQKGWGELHGLASAGTRAAKTYMMIYSPRDEKEVAITKQILDAAIKYSSFVP